jgi:hypothetical protein
MYEYPVYARLAAERPMITAYNLAIKDIAHPPVIHRVLRTDGRILVHAWDEIMVAGVKVTVHDEQGKLLEVGDAVQQEKDWWEYTLQAEGRVSATAWDIPGNKVHTERKSSIPGDSHLGPEEAKSLATCNWDCVDCHLFGEPPVERARRAFFTPPGLPQRGGERHNPCREGHKAISDPEYKSSVPASGVGVVGDCHLAPPGPAHSFPGGNCSKGMEGILFCPDRQRSGLLFVRIGNLGIAFRC